MRIFAPSRRQTPGVPINTPDRPGVADVMSRISNIRRGRPHTPRPGDFWTEALGDQMQLRYMGEANTEYYVTMTRASESVG